MEYTKEIVNGMFKEHGRLKVVFTKADGSERHMVCTVDMEDVPKEFHPKEVAEGEKRRERPPGLSSVYEIGVGWRSFYYSKIISVEPA